MTTLKGFHYTYDNGAYGIFAFEHALFAIRYQGMLECKYEDIPIIQEVAYEIDQYLKGQLKMFTVQFVMFTTFETHLQRLALEIVSNIPYGETMTYAELSNKLDGRLSEEQLEEYLSESRLPFIIPTHRVIRDKSDYGDFELGPKMKRQLIELEAKNSK
jgi:O-6-methylguanine DNA methyltransferase